MPQAPRAQRPPSRLSGEGSLTREREALLGSGSGVHATSEGEAPRLWWSLMGLSPSSAVLCWRTGDQCAVRVKTAGAAMGILVGKWCLVGFAGSLIVAATDQWGFQVNFRCCLAAANWVVAPVRESGYANLFCWTLRHPG